MSILPIDFEWRVDRGGYSFVEKSLLIIRRDGPLETIRPLEFHPKLYIQFAQINSLQDLVTFMETFGPITHLGHKSGEKLAGLQFRMLFMRRLIDLAQTSPRELLSFDTRSPALREAIMESWQQATEKNLPKPIDFAYPTWSENGPSEPANAGATVRAILRPGPPDGRPTLSLVPDTLWDAMLLQFLQAVSGGAQLKACAWCGGWFEVGGPTGKRADTRFCSDKCRVRSHLSKTKGNKR